MSQYEISIPSRVTPYGEHISYLVHPGYKRHKRSHSPEPEISKNTVHYKINVENKDLYLKVKHNNKLISPHLVIERRKNVYKNITDSKLEKLVDPGCHYHGDILGDPGSLVSLHVCDGLVSTHFYYVPKRNKLEVEEGGLGPFAKDFVRHFFF